MTITEEQLAEWELFHGRADDAISCEPTGADARFYEAAYVAMPQLIAEMRRLRGLLEHALDVVHQVDVAGHEYEKLDRLIYLGK